jgi:hypothetical protein
MPNWCENEIEISGDKETILGLMKKVETGENVFDFNTVIPYPKEYADLDADGDVWGKGYNNGGYDWCVENWGTKWNTDNPYVCFTAENSLIVSFQTAWSPSVPVTAELSRQFPSLTFTHRYEEGGMWFSGYSVFEDGEEVDSADGDYDDYPVTEHEDFDDGSEEIPPPVSP